MKKLITYVVSVTLISILFMPVMLVSAKVGQKMDVHLIDVGQGDSILIKTPHNKVILIDGGPPKAGKTVVDYIKQQDIHTIDLLITTHPHIDHIGGLPEVLKNIAVKQILDSGRIHATLTYAKYINQIRKQKIPMTIAKANTYIELDPSLSIKILNAHRPFKNNNQSSIALQITYDDIVFLFLGDIEAEQEKTISQRNIIDADFLKVAHHGSKTSSSLAFLERVKPEVALLTYSKKNRYGHPVKQVIENLQRTEAQIYSTAVFGHVTIHTNGKNYLIIPELSPLDGL